MSARAQDAPQSANAVWLREACQSGCHEGASQCFVHTHFVSEILVFCEVYDGFVMLRSYPWPYVELLCRSPINNYSRMGYGPNVRPWGKAGPFHSFNVNEPNLGTYRWLECGAEGRRSAQPYSSLWVNEIWCLDFKFLPHHSAWESLCSPFFVSIWSLR